MIFFPIVFICYWFVFKRLQIQNLFVVFASYIFYGMWDWRFLALIFLTSVTSFYSGRCIQRQRSDYRKRWIVAANLVLNLGILIYFKYFNFFSENLKILLEQFGFQLDWFTLEVLLPVGISFYTFQAISYSIDVYRGGVEPTNDLVSFLAFVSFFPQLVAGPIERSTNLLPQFLKSRHFKYEESVVGLRRMLWGFFKKMVIADNCAYMANIIFDHPENCNGSMLVLGALFFTFQIYGDFSGYSDIAIGASKLFGINLMQNFNYPYLSRTIPEFWRRWHISLNKWFVDYIYIPLGGSRVGSIKTARNIMIIFLISGLWHGAAWTFIVWGAYHGILMVVYRILGYRSDRTSIIAQDSFIPSVKELGGLLVTFVLVVIGWIVFRAESLYGAYTYLRLILTKSWLTVPFSEDGIGWIQLVYTLFFVSVLGIVEYIQRRKEYTLDLSTCPSKVVRWGIYLAVTFTIVIFAGSREQFIYFQF